MKQFINFNRFQYVKNSFPDSVKGLLVIVLLSIAVFFVSQLWVTFSILKYNDKIDLMEEGMRFQQSAVTELTKLAAQLTGENKDEEILADLFSEYEDKKAVMAILDGRIKGEKGFLPVLEGLASHGVEGVWLSNISLSQGGGILIEGGADSIQRIPLFAESLAGMKAFSLVDFSKMKVIQGEKGAPVSFSLSSTLYVTEER